MATYRQVQLRLNGEQTPTTLDLNTAPYKVEAGSWQSEPGRLQLNVIIQATSLAQLDRAVTAIRQIMAQADAYEYGLHAFPVYVYQKTCDALSYTAEIGAIWLRKRITTGQVTVPDASTQADEKYTASCSITMVVEDAWQRSVPAELLIGDSGSTTRTDGGVTQAANTVLTARRKTWSATTGWTVRVFWEYASAGTAQIHFFRDAGNIRLYWAGDSMRFYLTDNGGNSIDTGLYAFTPVVGQAIELIGVWSSTRMAIYINGVLAASRTGATTLIHPTTYQVLKPDSGANSQSILSYQIWPAALTDAECTGLRAWGMPDPELAYYIAPTSTELTAFYRSIYNVPGDTAAPMRMIVYGPTTQNWDKFIAHMRGLNAPVTPVWECESGTLGTDTAANTNSAASGSSQARFTPTATGFVTRVTVTLATDPDDVATLVGKHRFYLACYDSESATNKNLIRWRLVVAGIDDDWSEEFALSAVSTRSLIDLGLLEIPPGAWPDESQYATTKVYTTRPYVQLEIQVSNTTGSGGGTFDLDAVYLAPAEQEIEVECTDLITYDQSLVVDFVSEHINAITTRSMSSLEFATWAYQTGDALALTPRAGLSAFLWMYAYRNTAQSVLPRDTAGAYLFYRSRYLR